MFYILKRTDNIFMVHDMAKLGMNATLYVPWFALPTVDTISRWVISRSLLANNDYRYMFLNFPLHPDLEKYCGVDLSQLFAELTKNQSQGLIAVWLQNAICLCPSL